MLLDRYGMQPSEIYELGAEQVINLLDRAGQRDKMMTFPDMRSLQRYMMANG